MSRGIRYLGNSGSPMQRIALTLGLLATLAAPSPVLAQVFHDDFDGDDIDTAKWDVDPGGGVVTLNGGRLLLSAQCGEQFPYLLTRYNPFPETGDYYIRVGFQYRSVAAGGNGFGFDYAMSGFGIWQDSCCGSLRACVGDVYPYYIPNFASPDTSYHVYEWEYISGIYTLRIDGQLILSDESVFRPTQVFFGHPPQTYCPWTSQEIDFIHIETLAPTSTAIRSWGSVKTLYSR